MKSSAVAWAGSVVLHALILAGIFLLAEQMRSPARIDLVDFAILPHRDLSSVKKEAVISPAPLPPQPRQPPQAVVPPKPKPEPKPEPKPKPTPAPKPEPKPEPVIAERPEPAPKIAPQPDPVDENETTPTPETATSPTAVTGATEDTPPSLPAATSVTTGGMAPGTAKKQYLAAHFSYIRKSIMKMLKYPLLARKNGWSGQVKVSFIISEDGSIEDLQLVASSGHRLLDKNALAAVERACPFPKPPIRAAISLPITYRLN